MPDTKDNFNKKKIKIKVEPHCVEFPYSTCACGVLSWYLIFLPQYKDMYITVFGNTKLL